MGTYRNAFVIVVAFAITLCALGCASSEQTGTEYRRVEKPKTVPHSEWEVHPPLGIESDGVRRNLMPGERVSFRDLTVLLGGMTSAGDGGVDTVEVTLARGTDTANRTVAEGAAFTWKGYRVALVAAHTLQGELGQGRAEFEIAETADLPPELALSDSAGGATARLRIPHRIRQITLHHSGSEEPLRPDDDVPAKLRELQLWSEAERRWWDVPYHFLIGLDGKIYEGRDYRYRGETNTGYDVDGHFLISVLGNYNLQDATDAQIQSITHLMAWAAAEHKIPLDHIYGHSDLAETSCPGDNLRKYLVDGSFRRGIESRLGTR